MQHLGEFGSLVFQNIEIEFQRTNTVMRSALEDLDVSSFNCIVILADESHDEIDPDARTIMSLILLQDILATGPAIRWPQLVSEILDPRNRELIARAEVNDIIVSPEIVSMLLTQISQQQMLTAVYENLLSSGGVEIYLKPAMNYVELGKAISFAELIAATQVHQEIALGVCVGVDRLEPARNNGVQLNPPKQQSWTFNEHDRIIVLAQNLYE